MDRDRIREEFSPLLDGELTPEERAAVEHDLAQDSDLLRELEGIKRLDGLFRGLPRQEAPPELEARIRNAAHPRTMRLGRRHALPRRNLWPVLAAASALFVVVVTLIQVRGGAGRFDMAVAPQESAELSLEPAPPAASAPPPLAARATEEPAGLRMRGVGRLGGADIDGMAAEKSVSDELRQEAVVADAESAAVMDAAPLAKSAPAPAPALPPPPAPPQEPASPPPPAPMMMRAAPAPEPGPEPAPAPESKPEPAADDVVDFSEFEFVPAGASASAAPGAGESPKALSASPDAGRVGRDAPVAAAPPARRVGAREAAGRYFELRDGVWTERSYAGETTEPLLRGSEALDRFVAEHRELAALLELGDAIVFRVGDTWYRVAPASTEDSDR